MAVADKQAELPASSEGASRRWVFMGLIVPVLAIVDQITKQIADNELARRAAVPIIEGFFLLRYSRNRGAFFSLGEDLPDDYRRAVFVIATLIAIGVMLHLYRRADESQRRLRWALLLLVSGAVGNLIDRVLYGEVIDFLHLHYKDVVHWATFNLADVYICVGLVLLILDMVRSGKAQTTQASDST